jgi:membrane associated rhomboid family serine protease
MLIFYTAVYVLELLFVHWLNIPVFRLLQLHPLQSGRFILWQVPAHAVIHNPVAPISFLLKCLVFYFFAEPVERAFGSKGFLKLFYYSAAGGALFGLLFALIPGFNTPFWGMMPSLLAMIVIFGMLNPEATIYLMFIIPIKAKYISYLTVFITLLTFLAKVNPHGAYHLGGILFGYLYFKGPKYIFDIKKHAFKYQDWRFEKRRSKFRVIDGSRDKKKDEKDKPTYH